MNKSDIHLEIIKDYYGYSRDSVNVATKELFAHIEELNQKIKMLEDELQQERTLRL